ncbi:MAG TPA: EI24 domain-containing protein, partial [Oligoflexia bacterium]|nr:EI24 domain-containing protein [Oligoflexia bacterium]
MAKAGFWMGFWAPLRAAKMILKDPKLLSLAAIPLALNIGLYILLFHWGSGQIDALNQSLVQWMATKTPAWLTTLASWFLSIAAWVSLVLLSVISFTFVGSILSAPFNDGMSKRVYVIKQREALERGSSLEALPGLPLGTSLRLEILRTGILLSGGLFALLVGLIPLLQLPALIMGAILLSFEYFGYPFAQKEPRLGPVWGFVFRHPMVSLGFVSAPSGIGRARMRRKVPP